MGNRSESATPDISEDESGDAFTDADFGDTDEEILAYDDKGKNNNIPVNETVNKDIEMTNEIISDSNDSVDYNDEVRVNGVRRSNGTSSAGSESRRDSHGDQNHSIVGILGHQQNYAEQRLAARRAARAEAREIRMRELERQQREQEDHADKAYDMYTETVGRRTSVAPRLAALGGHSPRRCSEDSGDEPMSLKEMRHELKEVEEKFRKAMIVNAQLDNDKASFRYQLELLRDRIEELTEEYAQLQREHKEKCSSHERLKRSHASLERELDAARAAVLARDAAAAAAGRVFVAADAPAERAAGGEGGGPPMPALALVTADCEHALNECGPGTLDVRLQTLLSSKQALESEVRKLKLQLNEERAAKQNGVGNHEYNEEVEQLRKSCAEAKGRLARAESEAALASAASARLAAQLARQRAHAAAQDENEARLQHARRQLQREAREALNRVEELETENSHLTKRLDKLKNAKSALLKEL